jgi:hypothetical protein
MRGPFLLLNMKARVFDVGLGSEESFSSPTSIETAKQREQTIGTITLPNYQPHADSTAFARLDSDCSPCLHRTTVQQKSPPPGEGPEYTLLL